MMGSTIHESGVKNMVENLETQLLSLPQSCIYNTSSSTDQTQVWRLICEELIPSILRGLGWSESQIPKSAELLQTLQENYFEDYPNRLEKKQIEVSDELF